MNYFLFFEKHPVKEASWTLCTKRSYSLKGTKRIFEEDQFGISVIYCLFKATWMTQWRQRNRHAMLAELRGREGKATIMSVGFLRFHLYCKVIYPKYSNWKGYFLCFENWLILEFRKFLVFKVSIVWTDWSLSNWN